MYRKSTFLANKSASGAIEKEIMSKRKLVVEVQRSITGKFYNRKVYSSVKDDLSARQSADQEDKQLINT